MQRTSSEQLEQSDLGQATSLVWTPSHLENEGKCPGSLARGDQMRNKCKTAL